MPTKQGVQKRAPDDRMIGLTDAGLRTGYAPESLRKMMFQDGPRPPLFKVRGQWRAWLSDLDAWATARTDER